MEEKRAYQHLDIHWFLTAPPGSERDWPTDLQDGAGGSEGGGVGAAGHDQAHQRPGASCLHKDFEKEKWPLS